MLDELTAIDWSTISHAYGPATDVPELLRDLLNPSKHTEAVQQLFGNIWHQGTVYSASAPAVPFLLEIAGNPSTPDRPGVLALLACVATGSSYHEVHRRYLKDEKGVDQAIEMERGWVTDARRAVAEGFDVLMQLTNDASPLVRIAAANVLVRLGETEQRTTERLLQMRQQETQAACRAGLLLLMGIVRPVMPAILKEVQAALTSTNEAEAAAAAVSLSLLQKEKLTPMAIQLLKGYARDGSAFADLFDGLPWDFMADIDLESLAGPFITTADRQEKIDKITKELPSAVAVRRLVVEAFPMQRATISAEQLSALQRHVLRAIAPVVEQDLDFDTAWLTAYGLPASRRALRALSNGVQQLTNDNSRPVLASVSEPDQEISRKVLAANDQVIHRTYGTGTVQSVKLDKSCVTFLVDFGTEGRHKLMFPI